MEFCKNRAYSILVVFVTLTGSCLLISYILVRKQTIDGIVHKYLPVKQLNFSRQFSVCVRFSGRLGNQMFIYATSYATSLLKGMAVEVDKRSELHKTFKLFVNFQNTKYSKCNSTIKVIHERQSASFDKHILQFTPLSSVSLRTYLQSYLYFRNYSKEIQQQYKFHDHIQEAANVIFKNFCTKHGIANRTDYTFIGVHVRRGDMALQVKKDKNVGYNMPTKQYLERAINYYEKRYKNTYYVVITNGLRWTKDNMPKDINVEYIHGYSPAVELATVTMCNHSITTIGSFSWWSGWLTGGEVVYYKWPATDGSRYRKSFSLNYTDFFPPEWIGF